MTDYFQWNGLRIEIVDMDGKRIDKLLEMAAKMSSAAQ